MLFNILNLSHTWFCSADDDNCLGSFHVGCRVKQPKKFLQGKKIKRNLLGKTTKNFNCRVNNKKYWLPGKKTKNLAAG